jgi:phage gpG-like protein
MSGFIGVEIDGIDKIMADFRGYEREAEKAINTAVSQTSLMVQKDAKSRLNGLLGSAKHWITGNLAKSVYNRRVVSMEKVVGTNVEYAPYIEFGTGDLVEIPEGTEDIASQYKGQGIRKVNIKGDSFLNFAAVNQNKKHAERVAKELNKINR